MHADGYNQRLLKCPRSESNTDASVLKSEFADQLHYQECGCHLIPCPTVSSRADWNIWLTIIPDCLFQTWSRPPSSPWLWWHVLVELIPSRRDTKGAVITSLSASMLCSTENSSPEDLWFYWHCFFLLFVCLFFFCRLQHDTTSGITFMLFSSWWWQMHVWK